jgi:hypothetical protein
MVDSRAAVRRGVVDRVRSVLPGRAELRDLPLAMRIGFVLLAPGLAADVLVHGGLIASPVLADWGHVLVLAGMLLALAGAVARGLRQSLRREEM